MKITITLSSFLLAFTCLVGITNADESTMNLTENDTFQIYREVIIDSSKLKQADSLRNIGVQEYKQRNFSLSAEAYKRAHSLYAEEAQWSEAMKCMINLSHLAERTYQSKDSLNTLLDKAKLYVQKLPDTAYATAVYYKRLSTLSIRENNGLDGLFFLKKALRIIQLNPQEKSAINDHVRILQRMASIEMQLFNYNKAIYYYRETLQIRADVSILSSSRAQLFYIYTHLKQFEKAAEELKIIEDEELMKDAQLFVLYDFYNTLIEYYSETQQHNKAIKTLVFLDQLIQQSPYRKHFANWYFNQIEAGLYYAKGDYGKVIKLIDLDEIYNNLVQSNLHARSYDYKCKASSYYKLGDIDTSIKLLQEGINLFLPTDQKTNNFFEEVSYSKVALKASFFGLAHLKATISEDEYEKTGDARYKRIALHTFEELHHIIAAIGDYSDEDIFLDNSSFKSIYESYLNLVYQSYDEGNQVLFYEALQIIDESKSNAVAKELEAIKRAKIFASIPAELLKKEERIKNTLDTLYISQTTQNIELLSDSLQSDFEQLKLQFKKEYPAYYRVSYGDQLSIKELIENRFENVNMLQYFFGNEHIYIFQKNKNTLQFDRVPLTKQLNRAIMSYVSEIRNPNSREYEVYEQVLFQALFEKYISTNQQTLLVLDDKLHLLPESAIIFNQLSPKKTPPLFRVNSLSQYFENENEIKTSALIMAPFATHFPKDGKQMLPGSKIEASQVVKQIGGEIKLDAEATKETFLTLANKFSIVHIATHANLDTINPLKSSIYFAEGEHGLPSESYLLAEELYNVQLTADLITLSACETGLGKEIKGKGVQSLSNAFSYAGVPTTLISLWKIPDQQTAQIMNGFYKHLSEGKPKHKALQLAKNEYVSGQKVDALKHPYYWAGFVLSGDPSPIEASSPKTTYVWWFIGLLTLAGVSWIGYQRAKKAS